MLGGDCGSSDGNRYIFLKVIHTRYVYCQMENLLKSCRLTLWGPLAAICLVRFFREETAEALPFSQKPLWMGLSAKLATQFEHRNTVNMPSVAAHSQYLLIQLRWMTQDVV